MTINSSAYVFGNLGSGYTQYPDDYARDIFQKFYELSPALTQLTIRRDGHLMYYGYIRKLDVAGQYIGFCVLANDVMFISPTRLFAVFEDAVANLAASGNILQFADNGNIVSTLTQLSDSQRETERIAAAILSDVALMPQKKLPPVSYAIARDEEKTFGVGEKEEDIEEASSRYGFTIVLKDENCDSASLTSYRGILQRLNGEKHTLVKENEDLKTAFQKLTSQKKQYKKVVILCVFLIACAVGLLLLIITLDKKSSALSRTNSELYNAQSQITAQNDEIATKNSRISSLSAENSSLESRLYEAQEKAERLDEQLSEVRDEYPMVITDIQVANVNKGGNIETSYGGTIYSSSTMYLQPKITYTGIKTGENITLKVRLYTPSGTFSKGSTSSSDYSYSESVDVYSGSNEKVLIGWGGDTRGHWSSGNYRFEIWYNNVCLKAKSFYVY